MKRIIDKLDSTAGISAEGFVAAWLERLAFVFLFLMVVTSPHSIAASQISWLLGVIFWIARFFFTPRPGFVKTALFLPIILLFDWSFVSALVSYAPDISIGKLRGASLFLVFLFAVNNMRSLRAVRFLVIALIASCMINVIWMPVARIIGRGVEIQELASNSPIQKTNAKLGDTLTDVNGKIISGPADIVEAINSKGTATVRFYRPDFYLTFELKKSDLLLGDDASEKLGIKAWKKSMNWRSSGFYGHYATYAEVLQLVGSLTIGLFVAGLGFNLNQKRRESAKPNASDEAGFSEKTRRIKFASVILFISAAFMALALLLTVTRAPLAALVVSAGVICYFGAGRKMFLILVAVVIPIAIASLIFLQQSRNVGFIDSEDNSTTWRQTIYREGIELWSKNLRNITFGVGMDSIKRYKEEWHLFDDGRLPSGHFHSTPLQLVVERGFPALLFWLWMFAVYFSELFKAIRFDRFGNWKDKGVVLGGIGGGIGFLVSSLVHYNYGDGEVVMVLYLLMAFAVVTASFTLRKNVEAGRDPQ